MTKVVVYDISLPSIFSFFPSYTFRKPGATRRETAASDTRMCSAIF